LFGLCYPDSLGIPILASVVAFSEGVVSVFTLTFPQKVRAPNDPQMAAPRRVV